MKEKVISLIEKATKLKPEKISNLIEIPPSQELGDYAFPTFTLAKNLKKPPIQIAKELSKKINPSNEIEKIQAVGPYINFFINPNTLAEETIKQIQKQKDKYGSSKNNSLKKIMVEYSQPNTHKAFHIGHIRGTSLGESISRILAFNGDNVIRANYSGDTGMHIAKWIWCYMNFHKNEKLKDDESWIASIYVDAVKRISENELLQKDIDIINKKIENRSDKFINNLWKKTRKLSINSWKKIYQDLNTKFDVHFFESEVENEGKKIAEELFKKGIAEISDGATIVNLKKDNLGVWVVLRSDGTVLYSAKDLALAKRKFEKYKIEESIYVVGKEQELYFYQLFKVLELMKFKNAKKCKYIPINEVRFPHGKMSSRTGDNILYSDFLKEIISYIMNELKKRIKLSIKEKNKRALIIAIASIKYSMLKQDINKNLIFNRSEALSFEGNTGPYLLYTYARAKSILRKAKHKSTNLKISTISEKEKSLITLLANFPETVKHAYKQLAPNIIANYSYEISQKFNEFYHSGKVIGSKNENFKLKLIDSFVQVLRNSLTLLGIETLEKM